MKYVIFLKFLILCLILSLTSCRMSSIPDDAYLAERWFIDDTLKNPDKIDSIIDNSIYFSGRNRKLYLNDDTLRKYSSCMKTFKEKGYSYLYYDEVIATFSPVNIIRVQREIKIKCKGENLLERNFRVDDMNKVLVGDITYIWTREGWLYLSTVIDLYSRRVVGWKVDNRITKELGYIIIKRCFNKAQTCGRCNISLGQRKPVRK